MSRYWEEVRALYAPFESGPASAVGRGLRLRDAGRPVHEPVPAGQGAGPGVAVARGLQGVRRGQPALRRHRQGDADVEGRRRHGAVPGRQQPDARPTRSTPSASWRSPRAWSSSSRAGSASRRAASRRRSRSACSRAGPPLTERPGANLPPADLDAAREKAAALLGATGHRPRRPQLPALPARLPRPRRARADVFRHVDPADADLLLRARAGRREPRSRSSRARR